MRSNSSTSTISGRSRNSNNSSTDLISPNDQTNSHDHGKDTVDDGKVITPPENAPGMYDHLTHQVIIEGPRGKVG